jgi:hypothetical protein
MIAACYADETFDRVPEISKSFRPTFKGVTPSPFFATPLVGEEKFEIEPTFLKTVPSFKFNTFKVTPFMTTPFKFTPTFVNGEEKFTPFKFTPTFVHREEKLTPFKFTPTFVHGEEKFTPFKFTPTFVNGEEKFELIPELAKRIPIRKPTFENRDFIAPPVELVYKVPIGYAPPRAQPPPPPRPVYGSPTVNKNIGSSSVTIDPVFDYT